MNTSKKTKSVKVRPKKQVVSAAKKDSIVLETTRERLLILAADLFAERGFSSVSLDEITKNSGVTKGSLFWHFKNKREIYVECVKFVFESAFDGSGYKITAATPEKRLHQYLEWWVLAFYNNPLARRLMLRIITDRDTELMQELRTGQLAHSYVVFTEILKELNLRNDKTALSFFFYAIVTLNDELLDIANVWLPDYKKHVGGRKSIKFIEAMIKSW